MAKNRTMQAKLLKYKRLVSEERKLKTYDILAHTPMEIEEGKLNFFYHIPSNKNWWEV